MKTSTWMTSEANSYVSSAISFTKCTKKASPERGSLLLFLFLPFLLSFFALSGCSGPQPEVIKLSGHIFGTTWHITTYSDKHISKRREKKLISAIEKSLENINQSMSTYLPDSELNRFNRTSLNTWVEASPELIECLTIALQVSEKTAGAFDITISPLVDLWGFGPQVKEMKVPPKADMAAALARVNYKALEIEGDRIRKTADIALDLSAVAKGYAVDKVADVMTQHKFDNFLVEIGGEVKVTGNSPRGDKWRLGVEAPSMIIGKAQKAIAISNVAVATSGDYRNYFEMDGRRYSHTISPVTGMPITHTLASITVIADNTALADALATGLNVMGPENALAVAERENLAAYLIIKTNTGFTEQHSAAFAPYLGR